MKLRISLFGPLRVERDGRQLPERMWRSRQDRRLMTILLLARGATVPSTRLTEWLWPGIDSERAASTLRSTISSLRRTLTPGLKRASPAYIETRPGGYAWGKPTDTWSDIEAFSACFDSNDLTPPESDLKQALLLYRGDLLEDEPDAAWALAPREFYRTRFLRAAETLAMAHLGRGEYHATTQIARRGLDIDSLFEPLCRALMQAEAQAGDIAAALQAYERFRLTLDHELGAVPSPQTQTLHTAILRGELETARPPRAITYPNEPTLRTNRTLPLQRAIARQQILTPIAGRAAEIAQLRAWIAALERNNGGVVTLFGETGIGKSRLLMEAIAEAERREILPIVLRCTPIERALPLAALAEALRPLIRVAPEPLLRRLPVTALAQLAEFIPALRERVPSLPQLAPLPSDEARSRLVQGIVELGLALARLAPLVICIDDAQWADDTLLAVIGRLAHAIPGRAILLILTYRSEELTESPALHALLRELGRAMLLRPLLLGPVDQSALIEMLAVPPHLHTLAERLTQQSNGNPLMLHIALQALLEAHGARSLTALPSEMNQITVLPDLSRTAHIRDQVGARLARLPEPARSLIEQIAVLGRSVSLDLIEELGGEEALQHAQILLDRYFLTERENQRLEFAHDTMRATINSLLGAPRQRLLHRQVARALANLHRDAPEHSAEIALHLSQAGRALDLDLLHYALLAGDHALLTLGADAARPWYSEAAAATQRLGERAPPQLAQRATEALNQ